MSGLGALSLPELAALLALAFGLLAWLHLRAPRPVRKRVPYLAAWDDVAPARTAHPVRWAVTSSWPFLRALAFVALAGLALTDPQPEWLAGKPRSTLLVLDAGAHMRASDESPSRFEKARELALKWLESSSLGEVMVAELAAELTPLSGWERSLEPLTAAVRAASASYEPTRFAALAPFARLALHGKPSPAVIVFSDGAFETAQAELGALRDAGVELRQVPVGSSAANLAIRRFAVRAYPWDAERCEAMLELENTGDAARAVELTLFEDGRAIDVRPLQLPAASKTVHFMPLGASGTKLIARIAAQDGSKDAQPLDDEARAALAERRAARVLVVTEGQRYLESALALDPRLEVVPQKPAEYRSAADFDVAIFDRFAPSAPPGIPALWIAPPEGGPFRTTGVIERPFFDEVDTSRPLLRALSLRDVNIRRAQRVALEPGDQVLGGSKQGPLLVQGVRSDQPFLALTFDARESDLVLRTAWPVLIARALQQLLAAGEPGFEPSLTLGEVQSVAVGETQRAVLETPAGARTTLEAQDGRVELTPRSPGFYALHTDQGVQLLAANPSPDGAMDIRPRAFASRAGEAPAASVARAIPPRDRAWLALLGLAALVLAIDGFRLSRGRSS